MSCHSSHGGIASTRYARSVTNLDEGQVASVFHRLKRENKDAPNPELETVLVTIENMKRAIQDDPRISPDVTQQIISRYDRTLRQAHEGSVPDGPTWAAMQNVVIESEIAERSINQMVRASARQQRTDPDRLAAKFRKWRRERDYEDLESPDPDFIIDNSNIPSDKHTQRALRKIGFENYLAQKLPVFVYGTLRNGQGNDRLMNGAIEHRSEQAHVSGIAVYGASRGFPYAKESVDPSHLTKGDIVFLTDDQRGDWARESLDSLEGFDSDDFHQSHYRRLTSDVTYVDPDDKQTKTIKAWVYLAGEWAGADLQEQDRIHDGDWVQAKNNYRNRYPVFRNSYSSQPYEDDVYAEIVGGTTTPVHSAEESASVFESLWEEEELNESGGFWSQT